MDVLFHFYTILKRGQLRALGAPSGLVAVELARLHIGTEIPGKAIECRGKVGAASKQVVAGTAREKAFLFTRTTG